MSDPDLSVAEEMAAMSPAELTLLVHRLLARQEELEAAVAARDARIVELEAILEKRQRDGKRQAALFSKGKSGDAPASAGRKASRCPSPLPSSPS